MRVRRGLVALDTFGLVKCRDLHDVNAIGVEFEFRSRDRKGCLARWRMAGLGASAAYFRVYVFQGC